MNGDSTSGAGLQFDGLDRIITTNITDLLGAAYTLSAVTTTMRTIATAGGKPQALLHSYREHQKFSELVMGSYYKLTQAGAGSMADIPAGIAVTKWVSPFGTIDIIGSRFITASYTKTKAYIIDDKSLTKKRKIGQIKSDYIGGTPLVKLKDNTEERLEKFLESVETIRQTLLNRRRYSPSYAVTYRSSRNDYSPVVKNRLTSNRLNDGNAISMVKKLAPIVRRRHSDNLNSTISVKPQRKNWAIPRKGSQMRESVETIRGTVSKETDDIVRSACIDKDAEIGRNDLSPSVLEGVTRSDMMPVSSIDLALIASAYRTLVAEFTVMQVTIEAFQGKLINIGT